MCIVALVYCCAQWRTQCQVRTLWLCYVLVSCIWWALTERGIDVLQVIKVLRERFISNPEFDPNKVKAASTAAEGEWKRHTIQ